MMRFASSPQNLARQWLDVVVKRSIRPSERGRFRRKAKRSPVLTLECLESRCNPSATLVATSVFDSAVYELDATTGALLTTLVKPNSDLSDLSGPAAVTVGPDGNLYIASRFNDNIDEINLSSGKLSVFLDHMTVLDPIASANSDSVFSPSGLRFGPDGNLYVTLNGGQSAFSGGAVIRFNISSGAGGLAYSGTYAEVAGPLAPVPSTDLIQPTGLTFGVAPGDTNTLYVSNVGEGNVLRIANATAATPPAPTVFVPPGSGGLNYPSGLTWGTDGLFYVVDLGATSFQGNVLQFNSNGSFREIITSDAAGDPGNLVFQFPSDVLFDGQGHFLTANLGTSQTPPLTGSISQYNMDGSFSQTLVSSSQFPDMGTGDSGIAPSALALVPPLNTTSQLVISNLTPTSVTAGNTVSFKVTAEDSMGHVVPSYAGTVQLTSTDGQASLGGSPLPATYTFVPGDAGGHTFTVTLGTVGSRTITATDQNDAALTAPTGPITVTVGPLGKYLVNVLGSSTVQAGANFIATVQAADAYSNPITSYSGPATVTANSSPVSAGSSFPTTVNINPQGLGFFLANLQKVGSYTITASSGALTGSSTPVTVIAGAPVKIGFGAQPVNTPTGVTLPPLTVQILDAFGNVVASDNSDTVTVGLASGPGSFLTGSTTSVTVHNGVGTFSNLTLVKPGSYTLSELVPSLYTGANSTAFSVVPLQVLPGSFAGTPTGFSVSFNAPFLVNSTNPILFGQGFGPSAPAPTVTLTGPSGPVEGSLIVSTATSSLTFVETDTASEVNNLTPILPDGSYTVTITSSAAHNGLQALNAGGGFLDGTNSGTPGHDFTTTFTINAAAAGDDVLWTPATADGPGQALVAPGNNQAGGGYPIYLDAAPLSPLVTDVQATLSYNPALLTVTSTSTATFSAMVTTPGTVLLHYNGVGLNGMQVVLGTLTATVPLGMAGSPTLYKAKDLLHLSNVTINGSGSQVATADGLHLVAYVGDGDGNGNYSSNDAVLITRVGLQTDSGFVAYPLVDPVIVADTDDSGFIPADAPLQVNEAGVGFPTSNLPNPPIPPGAVFVPIGNNVDPTLSLELRAQSSEQNKGGIVTAAVNLDDADPAGSTGLLRGHLALSYDPGQFTVSAADVHLGSLLAGGRWSVTPTIDPATGQIGIALSSDTPLQSAVGGSLVTIDFHPIADEPGALATGPVCTPVAYAPGSSIALVASATPNGQYVATELEDAQGTFTLSPAPRNGTGVDLAATPLSAVSAPVLATEVPVVAAATPLSFAGAEAHVSESPTGESLPLVDDAEQDPPSFAAPAHGDHVMRDGLPAVFSWTVSPAAPLPGAVFPGLSAAAAAPGWQRLTDQLFQTLGRLAASVTEQPPLSQDFSQALPSLLSWSGADESETGALLESPREWSLRIDHSTRQPRTLEVPSTPPSSSEVPDRPAEDQAFTPAAAEVDSGAEVE
jgi:hypothetical protein